YKTLVDGHRQVIAFVLPGDFIGLQAGVMDVMTHSVEATTPMRLCTFNRSDLWTMFTAQPQRAFDMTHLAAREEHILGETLAVIGQFGAMEKISWALWRFYERLEALGLATGGNGNEVPLPFRQQDLADALGLSLVHTNKTLAKLRAAGVLIWADGKLTVLDEDRLMELGKIDGAVELPKRPLI
ncbi:MAG: Crp/Fnr family transcriptional regulator, partial [Shimia sp.]